MPCNVFPTLKSSQFGSTVFLRLQMSTIVLQYMITLKYFPKIPVQELTHVGLDRAGPTSSVIPQAPENSFLVVRVTMLEEGMETNQPECSSLYVFVTVRVSHYTSPHPLPQVEQTTTGM